MNQSEESLHVVEDNEDSDHPTSPNNSPFKNFHGQAEFSELVFGHESTFSPDRQSFRNLFFPTSICLSSIGF